MKILKKISLSVFENLDKFYHQKRILSFFLKNDIDIDNFIDIGAYEGEYSNLFFSKYKNAKFYLFEPQINLFKNLKFNFSKNSNFYLFNMAISNFKGDIEFYLDEHSSKSSLVKINTDNFYYKFKSFLLGSKKKLPELIKVNCNSLDQMFENENLKKIIIKIDTNGNELNTLAGMKKILSNCNFLIIEFHKLNTYLNYDPALIEIFLKENNFQLIKTFKFPLTNWEDRIYRKIK